MSLEEKILSIVTEHAGCDVSAESKFEDLPVDSLEFLSMVREVEDATKTIIGDEHLPRLRTVGELTKYIQNRLIVHDHVTG